MYKKTYQAVAGTNDWHTMDNGRWVQYTSDDGNMHIEYGDEGAEPPTPPQGLAKAYYDATAWLGRWNTRLRKLEYVFEFELRQRLDAPSAQGQHLKIMINGRGYWYFAVANRWGQLKWERISWPGDDVTVIEI
jgi:hypothetical protein